MIAAQKHGWDGGLARCLIFNGLAWLALPLWGALAAESTLSPEVLTNALAIRRLSGDQAEKGYPVKIQGIVTFFQAAWQGGFVQDASAGVYFILSSNTPVLEVGQKIELEGITDPGEFAPVIKSARANVVDRVPLPEAKRINFTRLMSGMEDSQWIQVQAVVRSVTWRTSLAVLLMATNNSSFEVCIPGFPESAVLPTNLVDAAVEVRGVAAVVLNSRREVTGFRMLVPSMDQIRVLKPAPEQWEQIPEQGIGSLRRFNSQGMPQHRIRVKGVVTLCRPGHSLFLQDVTGAIHVRASQTSLIQPGCTVEVAGFYEFKEGKLTLEDAVCQVISTNAAPSAMLVSAEALKTGGYEGRLVRLRAQLWQSWTMMGDESTLILKSGSTFLTAQLAIPTNHVAAPDPTVGSVLEVTGVFWPKDSGALSTGAPCLWLRSSSDLEVVERPSWWNQTRTMAVVAILMGVIAVTGIWIVALRRQVGQQTRQIRESMREREVLLQKRYRDLIENAHDIIFTVDDQGKFNTFNRAAENVTGYSREEIVQRTVIDLIWPEDQQLADQLIKPRNGGGMLTLRLKAKNGESRLVEMSSRSLRDETGLFQGTQVIARDVTERERTRQELAFEHDLLRTIMENVPDSVYFKDLKSRFVRLSTAMSELFGFADASQAIGKTDFDIFTLEHAQPAFDDEQRIISTGKPLIGLVEKETWQDKPATWTLTTKMPWRNQHGEIIGTFGISRDITKLKEAEEAVEKTHKQLLLASRQAGMAEVATSVLHNVGNVLNSINVATNTLATMVHRSRSSSLRKVADMISQHAAEPGFLSQHDQGKLIPQYLLQLSTHLESEKQGIIKELESLLENVAHIKDVVLMQQTYARMAGVSERIRLSELVNDAVRLNTGALARHDVQLVREFAADPDIVVERHKVLQILVNLIRNAKYACDEAAPPKKVITIHTDQDGDGHVFIKVIDNGVGIPKENLTRIFSYGFTTRKEGHGFGLHSSANAASEIGGDLAAASDGPGQGAIFTLKLPLQPPTHHQEAPTPER
jgi:PAS domain S-box-containing protein